jgi:hypothetical protein
MEILTYLFSFYPGPEFQWFYHLLIFFILTFIISIWVNFKLKGPEQRAWRKVFKKLPGHLQVLSTIGILLILSRTGGIGFFSMRMFLYVLLFTLVAIIATSIRKYFITLPQTHHEIAHQSDHRKYLPKGKKKRKKRRR